MPGAAAARWASDLRGRTIPAEVLAAAPESPWGFPVAAFRARSARSDRSAPSACTVRALEALPDGGSILDVGCGAGATSRPLAERAGRITGVDGQRDMVESFVDAFEASGVVVETVLGAWPEPAARLTGEADVVVSGHVLYNVQDLDRFIEALTSHARRRVVVEITAQHPLAWMHDLWERFHQVRFPSGPRAEDAHRAIVDLGVGAQIESSPADADRRGGFERREDAVALVRRRLCLPAARDAEIADALGDRLRAHDGLWSTGPPDGTPVVTIWWDV